MLGVESNIWKS